MNKKAPLATSYHKVLQSITKYYNVLVVLLRISPYYKVPLRTPIYEEMLCTTKYYNVVVYSVLQSIKNVLQTTATYSKIQLRIQTKFGGQTSEYGGMNSRDGKSQRMSRRETGKETEEKRYRRANCWESRKT